MKRVLLLLALFCTLCFAQEKGTFTDSRDGKTYKTVKIGTQTWMAENLDYAGTDGNMGACYNTDPKNCKKYGGLYTWNEAIKVCPNGWKLPSGDDWLALVNFVARDLNTAGRKLKSKNWSKNCGVTTVPAKINARGVIIEPEKKYNNCEDSFGFSALAGGGRNAFDNKFSDIDYEGNWWSSDKDSNGFISGYLYCKMVGNDGFGCSIASNTNGFSVRCVKQNDNDTFVSYVKSTSIDTANIELFLTRSKDYLNTPNSKGNTALSVAVNKKNAFAVKYLLDKGADVSIKSEQLGLTPLEDAATREDSTDNGIFAMLIEAQKKQDPEFMNVGSAMHLAARFGALKNVQLLVENGANINAKSLEGFTPLDEAIKEGRKAVVEYLKSIKKNDVNSLDLDGYTPMEREKMKIFLSSAIIFQTR